MGQFGFFDTDKRLKVKLPGSGGAADIVGTAKRLLVIMNHGPHRFVQRVSYVTSPGYFDGGDSRHQAGLDGGGPSVVITHLAILRPHGRDHELHLASIYETDFGVIKFEFIS